MYTEDNKNAVRNNTRKKPTQTSIAREEITVHSSAPALDLFERHRTPRSNTPAHFQNKNNKLIQTKKVRLTDGLRISTVEFFNSFLLVWSPVLQACHSSEDSQEPSVEPEPVSHPTIRFRTPNHCKQEFEVHVRPFHKH